MQFSNRRRAYVLRALMPGTLVVLCCISTIGTIYIKRYFAWYGDWRIFSQMGRSFFYMSLWVEIIAFSIIAASYAGASINNEWSQRTMELLLTSPISLRRIMYGKFFAVMTKLLFLGLATLPIIGMLFYVSHIPKVVGFAAVGFVIACSVLSGAVSYTFALTGGPGKSERSGLFLVGLVLFMIAPSVMPTLQIGRQSGSGLLRVFPTHVLGSLIGGYNPAAMSFKWYVLLLVGSMFVLSIILVLLSPILAVRSMKRRHGMQKKSSRFSFYKKDLGVLEEKQNPFYWIEKGARSNLLRIGVWIVGVFILFAHTDYLLTFGGSGISKNISLGNFIFDKFALLSLKSLSVLGALYAVTVFGREKLSKSSELIILTGQRPLRIFNAKIRNALHFIIYPCVFGVLMVLGHSLLIGEPRGMLFYRILFAAGMLYGLLGVILGLIFGASARSPSRGAIALVFSVVAGCALIRFFWSLSFLFFRNSNAGLWLTLVTAVFLVIVGIFCKLNRRWTVWRLAILFGTQLWFCAFFGAVFQLINSQRIRAVGLVTPHELYPLALLPVMVIFWYVLGLRIFERSMLDLRAD